MIIFFIFILISITSVRLHAEESLLPGFRSSVITDGKPILRGGGPEPPEEEEEKAVTDKTEVSREDAIARNSESRAVVDDLTVLIDYLMANYGYKIDTRTRRTDENVDSGPLEEEFRSHSKKQPELVPQRRFNDEHVEAHSVREILRQRRYWEKKAKKIFEHGVKRRRDMYTDKATPSRRANDANKTFSAHVRFFPHSWKNYDSTKLLFMVGEYNVLAPNKDRLKKLKLKRPMNNTDGFVNTSPQPHVSKNK